MNVRVAKSETRRQPRQLRARQTVDAIIEAVVRILKREGVDAVTTNRIADAAGVSIGSVYQYFPDKQAIFAAIHLRHVEQIDRIVESTLLQNASSPLDRLMRAMVNALIDAHVAEPELHALLLAQVTHHAGGTKDFAERLHPAFLLAISARSSELKRGRDLNKLAFVVTHMIESLSHGAVRQRHPHISLADMKAEIARAVMAYLRS